MLRRINYGNTVDTFFCYMRNVRWDFISLVEGLDA